MKLAVLSILSLMLLSCADLSPDPSREGGAAGSVAVSVESLTTAFTVINSDGGADINQYTLLNLLRFWVMQYTSTAHYQPTEWSCSSLYVNACSSNFGLPNWSIGTCGPATGGGRKCRLLKQGVDVGWAAQIPSGGAWYSQFNADNSSANGQLNPVKLTVVK